MAKKKISKNAADAVTTKKPPAAKKIPAGKKTPAGKKSATAKKSATKAKSQPRSAGPIKPRSAAQLRLTLPLARARKLAGDLYQSAGLNLWIDAIEQAQEPERATLIHLQDAICDAADFLKTAKAANPKRLKQFWVACFDRKGLPATKPAFITAASEEEALDLWREAFKGEYGVRKPRAHLVPDLGETAGLQG